MRTKGANRLMAKKRSHKNTTRLTARERAIAVVTTMFSDGGIYRNEGRPASWSVGLIEKAIQAAVCEALARDDRRDK